LQRFSFVPDKPRDGAALFSPDVADPYRASIGRKSAGCNAKSLNEIARGVSRFIGCAASTPFLFLVFRSPRNN
jgi:hypothetical protein